MSKTRRRYTDEYKREAMKLCGGGAVIAQVARDLGIDASMLRRWLQEQQSGRIQAGPLKTSLRSEAAAEVQRLQLELRQVTMERDILKKALGYLAKDPL